MNPGDLFKDAYYIKKKLRTIDECIDVYHVTYITESGDKNAMLFLLTPAFAGTKNGSVKFRSLYLTLRESGKIKKVIDYSMEGNDYYLIIPASSRQESQLSEPVDLSASESLPAGTANKENYGLPETGNSGKKSAASSKKAPRSKKHSLSRLFRAELYGIGIVLILCLIGAAGYYLTVHAPGQANPEQDSRNENQYTKMPYCVGLSINEAIELLDENNLYYKITYEDSDIYIKDAVCRQSVDAGTQIKRFSTVNIVVSNGSTQKAAENTTAAEESETTGGQDENPSNLSETSNNSNSSHDIKEVVSGSCKVPDLTNVWESNVESVISGAGLTLGTIHYEKHEGTERGKVFFQNVQAGDSVASGTVVDVWVSGS